MSTHICIGMCIDVCTDFDVDGLASSVGAWSQRSVRGGGGWAVWGNWLPQPSTSKEIGRAVCNGGGGSSHSIIKEIGLTPCLNLRHAFWPLRAMPRGQ